MILHDLEEEVINFICIFAVKPSMRPVKLCESLDKL